MCVDMLKTHYGWWKSTEGRAASGHHHFGFDSSIFFRAGGGGYESESEEEGDAGSVTEVDTGDGDDGSGGDGSGGDGSGVRKRDAMEEGGLSGDEEGAKGLLSRRGSSTRRGGFTEIEPSGKANAAYCNSISRLYIIVHNIEEAFGHSCGHGKYPSETYLDIQRALSVLAQCPVVSIVASMTSVNGPLHLGWDIRMLTSFQWQYYHTPTYIDHDVLPELLKICASAATRAGPEGGRGAKALKYILRSLTKKHCDVLKYLLKALEKTIDSKDSKVTAGATAGASVGDGNTKKDVAAQGSKESGISNTASSSGKNPGVMWTVLLSQCINQFIVKTDSELRQLIGELKDQRIVKTHSDSDGVLLVSLILSPIEVRSALDYFSNKKTVT
jgi:hypothetical protein